MTCLETSRLIGPFVDDELDARSVIDLETHLARCAACTQERSELPLCARRRGSGFLASIHPPASRSASSARLASRNPAVACPGGRVCWCWQPRARR
jgi:hypothetical protein